MVISGDLFNLFVFLEITSIASFSLVAFGIEAEELEAAFKYLVLGSLADLMILLAIGLLLGSVSTLNMADISRALSPSSAKNLIYYCLALFIMGFGLKAALVPFHGWLADAHPAAPAPMSAMLSGVVVKVAGIYALARVIFNLIGANFHPLTLPILNWLGIVSMLIGVLLAIGQWDFKRLLAYHSISQIGYIIFGLSLGTPLGITGGLFHLFNHSLFKSLLFLNAGAVEHASGSRKLDKLGNLSQQMPLTGTTSLLASLSITGIPPLCGFWSKLMIIIAALEANNFIGAGACILVAIITLASFLKVQKYVFLRKTDEVLVGIREAPFSMCLSMAVLALLCLLAGLCFAPFLETVIRPAAAALLRGTAYAQLVLGG
jgi:multicomponent Na+:H+ antiporter subunit D